MGGSTGRIVRLGVLGATGVAVYAILERWDLGWLLFAVGLGAGFLFLGLSAWHDRRAKRRLKDIQNELDQRSDGDRS